MNRILTIIFLIIIHNGWSQNSNLPNLTVNTINNKSVNVQSIAKEPLVILSFWATWCSNCIYELDNISYIYQDWKKETKVKIIAISIDDYRTITRVKPFLNSHQWPYDIWLDTNQKLKRAFNISDIPYTIILKKGKIVYRHSGYTPGNEDVIYEELKKNIDN